MIFFEVPNAHRLPKNRIELHQKSRPRHLFASKALYQRFVQHADEHRYYCLGAGVNG
jgi:hypothetical protein